ncbi:hypothetical protein [Actinoallomurus acanthiterrae]
MNNRALTVMSCTFLALTACSHPTPRVAVKGSIVVEDRNAPTTKFQWTDDGYCYTMGRDYLDIAAGAAVTVYDPKRKKVGSGTVGSQAHTGGFMDFGGVSRHSPTTCTFPFTVTGVPKQKLYGIEVAHHGVVNFTAAQVDAGQVKLTLGGPGGHN